MKRSLYILLIVLSALVLTTCKKRPELKIYNLELSEESVAVTPYTATITANYTYPGSIPQIKVYTSTSSSMADAIETDAVLDNSTMTATISNLSSDTKYYYRYRYSNGINLIYTDIKDFTTGHAIIAPTVVTVPITSISSNSAVSGGTITDNGGDDIIVKGVCWSTNEHPTIDDSHTSDGEGNDAYTSTITDLSPNTLYYVRAYASNSECIGYGNELSFTTSSTLAVLTTKSVTNITSTSANCGGNIAESGGMDITSRGVCWSVEHNPTISDAHTIDGSGIGEFDSEITGLNANVTYYVRAYATNGYGTSYGDEREFTTNVGMAAVSTNSISEITASSAVSGGNVTHDGGDNITARGVCWATTQNPTISNSHTSDGTGTGEFTSHITGLDNNVTYYVRAYATNSNGTAYGEERTFTTQEGLATITTYNVINITDNSAVSGGNITDDGGFSITARGVCWSTMQNPTTTNAHTTDGTGTGSFTSNLESLNYNTTYYVRAYATNSNGTSYGEEKVFTTSKLPPTVTTAEVTSITYNSAITGGDVTFDGGANVTARGVCYGTSPTPTISGQHTTNGNGTGPFTSTLTGLSENTTYYVRAYASNSEGTSYGEQLIFITLQAVSLPSVTTNDVTEITQTTAISGGNVTSAGNGTIFSKGVCWSTSQNPTISDYYTNDGDGTGSFTSNLTGLTCSTIYYIKAYATNEAGTAYGEQKSFTTDTPTTWNNGVLPGLFSISSTKKVYFSQGNLQYQASTDTWRFAVNQYDYIGNDNLYISSSYDGWIDLFGWGTSGWDCGNTYFHPWDKDNSDGSLYGPPGQYNLTNTYAYSDWGQYNSISNGGNQTDQWYTLSPGSWDYLINTRPASTLNGVSNARYAKATVNGVAGIILFPDTYTHPIGVPQPANINACGASFTVNNYQGNNWKLMENAGAVFLPAAGYRVHTSIFDVDSKGYYWSSCYYSIEAAWILYFHSNSVNTNNTLENRYCGQSVRLVQDFNVK